MKNKLGQIFTPNYIVIKILDDVVFNNDNILQKKILEPSCGDGRFLTEDVFVMKTNKIASIQLTLMILVILIFVII